MTAKHDVIKHCENKIAAFFDKRYCVLTGNGTTALKIACESVSKVNILVPATACFNVPMAVRFAEKIPVFADILETDATIDSYEVEQAINTNPDIGAVIIVHLYGHPAHTSEIMDICRKRGVLAIEDTAQAMGGKYSDGSLLGTLGDVTIVSFGHTKILDTGGGGALLTDDAELYRVAREKSVQLPFCSEREKELTSLYRKFFYAIWEAGRIDENFFVLYNYFPELFEELFVFSTSESNAEKILSALPDLEQAVLNRIEVAKIYKDALQGIGALQFFKPLPTAVPWRFTFRMDSRIRRQVIEKVRKNNYDISNWYPCYVDWISGKEKYDKATFPIARKMTNEVVNLWVAEGYSNEKAAGLADLIRSTVIESAKEISN